MRTLPFVQIHSNSEEGGTKKRVEYLKYFVTTTKVAGASLDYHFEEEKRKN